MRIGETTEDALRLGASIAIGVRQREDFSATGNVKNAFGAHRHHAGALEIGGEDSDGEALGQSQIVEWGDSRRSRSGRLGRGTCH